jgi:site-specific DNA recombinase
MRGRKAKALRERISVGYVRVSTREQSSEGHSLGAQESRLRSLANSQGVELGRVFVDAGFSAKNLKRPAVTELLAAIRAGGISALYISKLDRLCRNLADLLAIVRLCEKHEVALVSASEAIDTGSPAGRMMLTMLGGFAEFERDRISERISDVAFDLRENRKVYCRYAPFGYRRAGAELVKDDAEQIALVGMRRMHSDGASYRQIATWLTETGVPPKGRAWYAASVRDVLRSRMNAAQ